MPYNWRGGDYEAVGHYGYPDYPDGSLRTGAEQLGRFLAMGLGRGSLDERVYLEAATFEEMLRPQYPALDRTQGLGWYSWTVAGEEIWGHTGGDVGVATEVGLRLSDSSGYLVLQNSQGIGSVPGGTLARLLLEAEAEL